MGTLKGFQKKYLRGLAHGLKPIVLIGQKGLTPELVKSIDEALEIHELVKIKFNDFKEKHEKEEISGAIERKTGTEPVGAVGHTVILYRQQGDPEKRRIDLPENREALKEAGRA